MSRTIPNPERKHLGFKDEVLKAFEFLITNYGFLCVQSEITFVRYESKNVFVNIYHGRASYELGFEVGLLSDKERAFSLGDIIGLKDEQRETMYTVFQASTKERVKKYIFKLAELVEKYARDALRGDKLTFQKLEEIVLQRSNAYLKEIQLNRIRKEAEKAWCNKEYEKLIKLYESIKADLTPAEIKKLDYSRKHRSK